MARKPKEVRLEAIYRAVEQNPGHRPGFIARLLGLNRSEVTRALPTLEQRGYMLSEDQRGCLWLFKRRR